MKLEDKLEKLIPPGTIIVCWLLEKTIEITITSGDAWFKKPLWATNSVKGECELLRVYPDNVFLKLLTEM